MLAQPPTASICTKYLREIADKHQVAWTPTQTALSEEEELMRASESCSGVGGDAEQWCDVHSRPAPPSVAGCAVAVPPPTGFSIPMAPGTHFGHLYSADIPVCRQAGQPQET